MRTHHPTVYDIAERVGVSVATVSRVLNRAPGVRPSTVEAVLRAARDLGYVPRTAAPTIAGRTRVIGMAVPDVRNPFFAEMVQWTSRCCQSLGYSLMVSVVTDDDPEALDPQLGQVEAGILDGLLIGTASEGDRFLEPLAQRALPVVLVARDVDSTVFSSVVTDDERGGMLAAGHFMAEGHRRLAIITEDMRWKSSRDRLRGFAEALSAHGVTDVHHLVATAPTDDRGYLACREYFRDGPLPTAVFATTDLLALGVLRYAYEQHLSVPSDLSVIGYDGTIVSLLASPPLSSIRQPLEEMCRTALETLLDLSAHRGVLPRKVALPPSLVLHGTTRIGGSGSPE